jgi:hypothetical protein
VRTLRKLVLGETWSLPAGIAAALVVSAAVRWLSGDDGWWRAAGGWVLLALLVAAFGGTLLRARNHL